MAVYQPNAVVGNSRVLAALGEHGELMTFFYPHIDFTQNLHEGMPAVYFPGDTGKPGQLVWTFDPAWRASQRYRPHTNIVETELLHADRGLALYITDFVHPEEPALLRRFTAENTTSQPLTVTVFQYLDLQLGEIEQKNAIHFHADRSTAVAYWRNICFAITGSDFDEYGCGRAAAGSTNSAKLQLARGALNRQQEEIGDIDLAVGWRLTLPPGASAARVFILAADSSEQAAVARAEGLRELGWEALLNWTTARAEEFLQPAQPVQLPPDLTAAYHRCLLAVDLLADRDTGSMLAAPEFDPFFERSGGYGYCWPRDAVEACLSLEAAGYRDYLARFLTWACRAQRPEGYWEQRYWLNGQRGPAWCTAHDSLQIDQTASVLFAMGRHARMLGTHACLAFLEQVWDSAHRAADWLCRALSPETGLHSPAFDLWETFRGTFTYSNGAIAAALREAAFLAQAVGEDTLASRWGNAGEDLTRVLLARFWQDGYFLRGLTASGEVDRTVDASALGLITPFEVLRLRDPEELAMARRAVEVIAEKLRVSAYGGAALLRFEGDSYAGGGPSAVATIWFAQALLCLASAPGTDRGTAKDFREQARECLRTALRSGTTTGLLPEMMGTGPGAHWAAPHAWAMGAFAKACLLLSRDQN